MSNTTLAHAPAPTDEQIDRILDATGAANGGIASSGIFESRDVLGSLRYVRDRRDTRHMTIGLFSRCLGCSSTFCAMTKDRHAFDGVRCLVGPQPPLAHNSRYS